MASMLCPAKACSLATSPMEVNSAAVAKGSVRSASINSLAGASSVDVFRRRESGAGICLSRSSARSRDRQPETSLAATSFGVCALVVEEAPATSTSDSSAAEAGPEAYDLPLSSLLLRQAFSLDMEDPVSNRTLSHPDFLLSPSPTTDESESILPRESQGQLLQEGLGSESASINQLPSSINQTATLGVPSATAAMSTSESHCTKLESLTSAQHGQVFGAVLQSEPPPAREQEKKLGDDYHVNVGYAIRTLREELPTLFYKEMSYDIYRDDITFQDPLNTFRGLKSYQTIFWALRFHGRIFFKALCVDVNRVWQPNDRTITIRWSVRGIPRVPWEAWGRFDGTSEYKLDKNGKIYAHKVDNVALSDPPRYRPLTVLELLQLEGVQRTPGITCFKAGSARWTARGGQAEVSGRSLGKCASSGFLWATWAGDSTGALKQDEEATDCEHKQGLAPISWFRFYLALSGTLALRDDLDFAAKVFLLA